MIINLIQHRSTKRLLVIGTTLTTLAVADALWLCHPTPAQYYPAYPSGPSSTECDSFARDYARNYAQGGLIGGAARGAAGGALFGAIFGRRRRGAGRGAAWGAALGAIGGGIRQSAERDQLYSMAFNDCMNRYSPY